MNALNILQSSEYSRQSLAKAHASSQNAYMPSETGPTPSWLDRLISRINTLSYLLFSSPQIFWRKISQQKNAARINVNLIHDGADLLSDTKRKIQSLIQQPSIEGEKTGEDAESEFVTVDGPDMEEEPLEHFLISSNSINTISPEHYLTTLNRLSGAPLSAAPANYSLLQRWAYKPRLDRNAVLTILRSQEQRTINDDVIIYTKPFLRPETSFDQIIRDITNSLNWQNNKIAIPLVVNHGDQNDHIVTLFIDRKNNTIDFFCSKGYSWRNDSMNTLSGQNWSVRKLITNLILKQLWENSLSPEASITVNQLNTSIQTDSDQCGIFVADALCQFLRGKSLRDEGFHLLTSKAAREHARISMGLDILSKLDTEDPAAN